MGQGLSLRNRVGFRRALAGCSALVGLFAIGKFAAAVANDAVVPDGSTSTVVSTDSAGKTTIAIAPADPSSISLNRFQNFNVPSVGVDLDNRTANAGTIINEVTSNSPSALKGALSVLGVKAHVIVANPNGIVVDGGSFQNTNNVALSTGTIDFDVSGQPRSVVRTGDISIQSNGISGTMAELDLLAKKVSVDGAITHDNGASNPATNLIVGDSEVVFDATVPPDGLLPWAQLRRAGSSSSDVTIVDITSAASINSGRISISVTEAGAGVRSAGGILASTGGFRLSSTGKIELTGSEVIAHKSINIRAAEIDLGRAAKRANLKSAESGVVIETTSGDIRLGNAKIEGKIVASDNLASAGGVTLISQHDIVRARDVSGSRANLVSHEASIALFADGAIRLAGVDVSSGRDFRLSAAGKVDLRNIQAPELQDFRVISDAAVSIRQSKITAAQNVRIDGQSISTGHENDAKENIARTEIIARSGGVVFKTVAGSITNNGGLIQGKIKTSGDSDSAGAVTILSDADFDNRSLGKDHVAIISSSQENANGEIDGIVDDVVVKTRGDARNDHGRFRSWGGISVEAGGDFTNETVLTGTVQPYTVKRTKGNRLASALFLKRRKKTRITANFGEQLVPQELAVVVAVGDLNVTAATIRNAGGDFTARNIKLSASATVENNAKQSGSIDFQQNCALRCSASGYAQIASLGGIMFASSDLELSASDAIQSTGGQFVGFDGVSLTAPFIRTAQLIRPVVLQRPTGLSSFFRGRSFWMGQAIDGTNISSALGQVIFNGSVSLEGAQIASLQEPDINGENLTSDAASAPLPLYREPLGLLWGFL